MAAVSVSRDVGLALVVVSALVATACGAAEPEPAVETVTVTSMADPSPVVGPSTPATQASLAWADVMDRVRPAVVRVSAGTCGEATSLASGFFMDDRHIVTAAHVVDGSSKVSVQVDNSDFMVYLFSPAGTSLRALPEFPAYIRAKGFPALWDKYGAPDMCTKSTRDEYACQ